LAGKISFFDQLNNFGFGLYIATVGAISYIFIKAIKKLVDIMCSSILEKYFESIRKAVDEYMQPLNEKIEKIEKNTKTDRERSHDAIAKNEGVLLRALDVIDEYEKKLNEKTIINIPTSKHKG